MGYQGVQRSRQSVRPVEFQEGDRVERQVNVHDKSKGMLHGMVVQVRIRVGSAALYDVQWDEREQVDKGYFAHGLQLVESGALSSIHLV